jgi:hypothetical protein
VVSPSRTACLTVITSVKGDPFAFQRGWGDPYRTQLGLFALADPLDICGEASPRMLLWVVKRWRGVL